MNAFSPTMDRRRILRSLAALGATASASALGGHASAQSGPYPNRPIRLTVAAPPGGSLDAVSRLVTEAMGEKLGVTIPIENKPGAGSIVGSAPIATATPDGYTLLVSNVSSHGISPALYPSVPYDPMKNFTHIGLFGSLPNVLLVKADSPIRTVEDLVKLAKGKEVAYGSAGNGSTPHLAAEILRNRGGLKLLHIPYRGAAAARMALLSGEVQMIFENLPAAVPYVEKGDVRALLVAGTKRSPLLPNIPTGNELGFKGLVSEAWYGLSGPAGLPEPIVTKLNTTLNDVLRTEAIASRLAQMGVTVTPMTPEQYTDFIKSELEKWATVIKEGNVKVD